MRTNKKVVLVVDDEEAIREYVRYIIEKEGYTVIEAENGAQALDYFRTFHIDLMLTDLIMPEKEGIETILSLKTDYPDVKIAAMSGVAESETYLRSAGKLGADAVLRKPFEKTKLVEIVNDLMGAEKYAENK
ncbi:MAG: response regulator [Chitinivibrionales bacterium]|nr:response regulator [Chitinivibrionales bacterium]